MIQSIRWYGEVIGRSRLIIAFMLSIAAGTLGAGCGDPAPSRPEAIELRTTHGVIQQADVGSFCWDDVCASNPRSIPRQAIPIASTKPITLSFSNLPTPSKVTYQVFSFDDSMALPDASDEDHIVVASQDPPVRTGTLEAAPTVTFTLDLAVGQYILVIHSQHDRGTTAQSFHILIL